ncbi:MAG: YCF48-related protein [Alphaproteobacteria bacterium]|nr:YCF48-related protein [Alphaproteobacteria bacterium]
MGRLVPVAAGLAMIVLEGAAAYADCAATSVAAPLASRSLLLDGADTGSSLVVVGDRGHVLVSADQGASWKQSTVPTRVLLTAVDFVDVKDGWAVGHDAVILRTRDGGATWRIVHCAPEEERPLLDVWFRDAKNGFAVGAYGYFLETRDGGETWHSRFISDDDFHLNVLVPADADGTRLFIAGEAGAIYRSDDAGRTWRALPSPYAGSWFGAVALDRDRLVLAGLKGRLFQSIDAGETWSRIATEVQSTLTGMLRLDDGRLLLTGLEGVILTLDPRSPESRLDRLAARPALAGALELANRSVLLFGQPGVLRHRTGGED